MGLPSIEYIEDCIGRYLTPYERARVEERIRRLREVYKEIDDGKFDEAKRLINILKNDWGDLNADIIRAEVTLDWARMPDESSTT